LIGTERAGRPPTRREALRILALGGVAALGWRLGGSLDPRVRSIERSRVLMGTRVQLQVAGDDPDAAALAAEAALERMAGLESLLSRHRADSEVGRLNATGRVENASDALLDVLGLAERIARLGDGAFDITVQPLLDLYRGHVRRGVGLPGGAALEEALARVDHRGVRIRGRTVTLDEPGMQITLDGIGKGWIVDRGVEVLQGQGFGSVFVEAGGDLVAGGASARGDAWRIGIRSPRRLLALQARFDARDRAVATSGDYMQPFAPDYSQHHILDPRTGSSAPELASSTVVAGDAATADALATLVMVLGPVAGRRLLEDLPGCEGYLVTKQLEVVRTSGFGLA
jgi:thiamine biosynthesis lipoprotein